MRLEDATVRMMHTVMPYKCQEYTLARAHSHKYILRHVHSHSAPSHDYIQHFFLMRVVCIAVISRGVHSVMTVTIRRTKRTRHVVNLHKINAAVSVIPACISLTESAFI